jgi:hypothetical protein
LHSSVSRLLKLIQKWRRIAFNSWANDVNLWKKKEIIYFWKEEEKRREERSSYAVKKIFQYFNISSLFKIWFNKLDF